MEMMDDIKMDHRNISFDDLNELRVMSSGKR
jgi:hypothetical protein